MSEFVVLKKATINKQDIQTNSPNKTFSAEWQSLVELEIINEKPIPKLQPATTSPKPLTYITVSSETDVANASMKKTGMPIRSTPTIK